MKRFVVTSVMVLALCMGAFAQVSLNGNVFSSSKGSKAKKDTIITKYQYETQSGKWTIILSPKGSAYYYAVGADGKKVRRNCPHEVSEQLAKVYHTGYVYKPRKKSAKN